MDDAKTENIKTVDLKNKSSNADAFMIATCSSTKHANATADDNAFFGDTDPTSSQFRVGGDNGVNGNSDAMIAYLWSEKQGFSRFGSYTGNGDNNGPFVFTGFSPAFIMIKRSDSTGQWGMNDTKRDFNDEYGNDNSVFADNQPQTVTVLYIIGF